MLVLILFIYCLQLILCSILEASSLHKIYIYADVSWKSGHSCVCWTIHVWYSKIYNWVKWITEFIFCMWNLDFHCNLLCTVHTATMRRSSMPADVRSWFRNMDPGSRLIWIQGLRYLDGIKPWWLTWSQWSNSWGDLHFTCLVHKDNWWLYWFSVLCLNFGDKSTSHFFLIVKNHDLWHLCFADTTILRKILYPVVTSATQNRTVKTPSPLALIWTLPTAPTLLERWDSDLMVERTWRQAVTVASVSSKNMFAISTTNSVFLCSHSWHPLACIRTIRCWLPVAPHGTRCLHSSGAHLHTVTCCTWAIQTAGPFPLSMSDGELSELKVA